MNDYSNRPSLSVVIPAYNESHRLPQTLSELRAYLEPHFPRHEVIVVDDGGTDGTAELTLAAAKNWPQLRLLKQPMNMGKGAAVRRGMLDATSELVLFMDADHATPISEMENVLPHFAETHNRAVVGVRTYQQGESKWRRVVGLTLQIIAHVIVFELAVVDSQCGFKCFGRDTAKRVFGPSRTKGGMFDVEIFAIMHKQNIDVVYQPVHWANKAGSRINFIRCCLLDPFDMMGIRLNAMSGRYSGESVARISDQTAT